MSERLILQGALQEKKMERMRLAVQADGLIRSLRMAIQPAVITPLAEVHTAEIREQAAELDRIRADYMRITAEIIEIEKELGHGR